MSEPVAINPVPIPEAFTQDEVDKKFQEMANGEIPAFIMRAANIEMDDAPQTLAETASRVSGMEYTLGPTYNVVIGPDSTHKDVGLHADAPINPEEDEHYHVWEATDEGEAELSVAAPGHSLAESGINERSDERLNRLFRAGMTDPALMHPTVNRDIVRRGDKVVFPVSGRRPAWHNVDTVGDSRSSRITVIKRKPVDLQPRFADDEGD